MSLSFPTAATLAAALVVSAPAGAQATQPGSFGGSLPSQSSAASSPAESAQCELRVWPTQNYLGFNSGLLSGFGPLGALADMAARLLADWGQPRSWIDEQSELTATGLASSRITRPCARVAYL